MKHICTIITLLLILSACNSKPEKSDTRTYKRISDKDSWGYVDNKNETVIPLGKYKFLNPIDEEGMILAQLDNKFGYIDIHQNILIPFGFDDLSVFSEGLAPAKKNGKYGYINRNGEVIIPFKFDAEKHFYKSGLSEASLNGKWGFINKNGQEIVPIKYSKVECHEMDGKFIFVGNNKWAIFDNNGKQLSDFIYDEIYGTTYNFDYYKENYLFKGLLLVRKDNMYSYLNRDLKTVFDFGYYSYAEPVNECGYAIVKKGNNFGVIDSIGGIVVANEYSLIEHPRCPYQGFYNEFYIHKNGKVGLLNDNAEFISKIIYDSFDRNYCKINDSIQVVFIANKNNKYGIIDKSGKITLPIDYQEINRFEGNSFTIAKKDNVYGLITSNGEIKLPFEYLKIESYKDWDYYIINKDNFFGIIDKQNLQTILPLEYQDLKQCFYDNNKFIAKRNGFYGIITRKQDVIIPFEYDKISNWVEYGPEEHFVIKNGKHGLISREGEIVIPPVYDEIQVDNTFLIKVKKNGLYGTINWKNKVVHPIQYEQILWEWPYMTEKELDTIYVKKSGNYFATDIEGKVIVDTVSDKIIERKFGYLLRKE